VVGETGGEVGNRKLPPPDQESKHMFDFFENRLGDHEISQPGWPNPRKAARQQGST
jgi:hypothetical protein